MRLPIAKTFPLLGLLLLGAAVLYFFSSGSDPAYRGKPMGKWLQELEDDPAGTDGVTSQTLCKGGPEVVPSLLAGLHKADDSHTKHQALRLRCAFVLGYVEPTTPEIVRALKRSLSSDDVYLIIFVSQALRMISEREAGMVGELEKTLPDLRAAIASGKDERGQVARAVASIESRVHRTTMQ